MLLRHSWRSIRSRPGLAATVVLSLAVGLGANAVLFAVVDGAMLRPFPFPEPDRLVGIGAAYPKLNRPLSFFEALSGPEYADVAGAGGLRDVVAFDLGNEPVTIGDTPERVFTAFVWGDPLRALGLPAGRGRSFSDEELRTAAPVAVVSHAFWQTRLGGRLDVVGSDIRVAGRPHAVIGVMPARTRVYGTDLWIPMADQAASLPRNRRQFNVLARLAPEASIETANQALEQLARRIEGDHRAAQTDYEGFSLAARPWTEIEVWGFGGVTAITFGAVGLILLLVTANLASLVAAGSAARRGEMAVRLAIGASPRRLLALLSTETLLQAAMGALAGLVFAWIGVRALPGLLPDGILPPDAALGISPRVFAFVIAIAALAAVLVSLAPTLQLLRTPAVAVLNADAGRSSGSRATRRLHQFIVAFEVAAAVMVTGSAALLGMHTLRLLQVDRGFDSSNVVAARFTLPLTKYDGTSSLAFFDALLERVRALPAVASATVSNQPPPGVFSRSPFVIEGRPSDAGGRLPATFYSSVGSGYPFTMGLRLTRGRWFNEQAPISATREVVINDTLAARFFTGEDPIGRRVQIQGAANDGAWADVVGVAADVRNAGLAAPTQPEMFASIRQIPDRRRTQAYLVIRGREDAMSVLPDVRAIVRGLDPGQPMYAISTLDDQYDAGVATRRVAAWLLGSFSAGALGLACLGLFGVLSHSVNERRREIGLRCALGAGTPAVVRLVLGDALRPVLLGIVAGLLSVVAGQHMLASWLYGITPEWAPLFVVAGAVLAVSMAAGARPILRASRLSPLEIMR